MRRGSRGGVERIGSGFRHGDLCICVEVGAFEHCGGLRVDFFWELFLLATRLFRQSVFGGPFWGQLLLTFRELRKTLAVVAVPQVELEIFGIMLNMEKEVHKLAGRHGLQGMVYQNLKEIAQGREQANDLQGRYLH